MSVQEAALKAEEVLPGKQADSGLDPRWQAIIAIGEYVETDPEDVWEFINVWGCFPDDDLRSAVACCLLEHVLEYHFQLIFPRVEQLALEDELFADTFLESWKFGQSEEPENAARFDALRERLLEMGRGVARPWDDSD